MSPILENLIVNTASERERAINNDKKQRSISGNEATEGIKLSDQRKQGTGNYLISSTSRLKFSLRGTHAGKAVDPGYL